VKTRECEIIGRLAFPDLPPDTEWELRVRAEEAEVVARVRTLPAPRGERRGGFAVLADPHITPNPEMRRGRLFPESAVLVREILREVAAEGLDFVVIPGDLTNHGRPEEFALARAVLAESPCPVLVAVGDHDLMTDPGLFEKTWGPLRWARSIAGFRVIGCCAVPGHHGPMPDDQLDWLTAEVRAAREPVVLVGHAQFIADDYILDKDKVIANGPAFAERVAAACPPGSMAYVGHKNVPAHVACGPLLQVNAPQCVQYPCGYLVVRRYANGLYHHFAPIFSEVLNDFSRRTGNALDVAIWKNTYRRGRSYALWNFVHPIPEPQ